MSGESNRVVILENGLWEMKLGFSGEELPRYQRRSVVGSGKNSAITASSTNREVFIGQDAIDNQHILNLSSALCGPQDCDWSVLEKLWYSLFYGELQVPLDSFPLFLVLNSFFDKPKKLKLVELLFENYDFPALYFNLSNVTGLFYDGRTTGMALDSGFSQTSCTTIFEGYPIEEKLVKSEFGGRALNEFFKTEFNAAVERQKSGFKIRSDFYDHYGYRFSEPYYESLRMSLVGSGFGQKTVLLPDNNEAVLAAEQLDGYREHCVNSTADLIHRCFAISEEKYRPEFGQSISLIGGNSILVELEPRLQEALQSRGMKQFSIAEKTDDEKRYASWIGASLFASLDNFQNLLIKRSEYQEGGAMAIIKKNLV